MLQGVREEIKKVAYLCPSEANVEAWIDPDTRKVHVLINIDTQLLQSLGPQKWT